MQIAIAGNCDFWLTLVHTLLCLALCTFDCRWFRSVYTVPHDLSASSKYVLGEEGAGRRPCGPGLGGEGAEERVIGELPLGDLAEVRLERLCDGGKGTVTGGGDGSDEGVGGSRLLAARRGGAAR